jgi:PAS domain S-box-containing protein
MKDDEKTREQIVIELKELRLQYAKLEKSITDNKKAELMIQEGDHYSRSILDTIRHPIIIMDETLKVISANKCFYTTFNETPGKTIGNFVYDLGNKQWNIPKLLELLEKIIPEKESFSNLEIEHDFLDIGHKFMRLNARQMYRQGTTSNIIILAIEDITKHRLLEDLLKESEYTFRRAFETANDSILLLEKSKGKIDRVNPATERMLGYTEDECIGQKLQDIGVFLEASDIKMIIQALDKNGIINYKNIPIKTKSGQRLAGDIYLVNKSHLIQCNIRDITESQQVKELLEETNRVFIGREKRMIELKEQILKMEKQKEE